jgi:hypothetical protein
MVRSFFFVLTVVLAASVVSAGTISYVGVGDTSGTGFGSVLSLLSLQADSSEWGGVSWTAAGDVLSGDAKDAAVHTKTVGVSELGWSPGLDVAIVFNVNEDGNPKVLDLVAFTVYGYQLDGTQPASWSWTYSAPGGKKTLDAADQGTGTSGFLFRLDPDSDLTAFLSTGTNRIGMEVSRSTPIDQTGDGQDNFWAATLNPVPLPPAAAMGLVGLGGAALLGWWRRRRCQA